MLKQSISIFLCAAIIGCISVSCTGDKEVQESSEGLQGEITISGAFALKPLVDKWAEEFQKANPDVVIDVSGGGAGKGMTDVLSNMVDLGMVSREVFPAELEKGAYPIGVAIDAVVPTINASNPLLAELKKTGLTRKKAQEIWIAQTCKSWESVLGKTGKTDIHVYNRSDACGAAETFALWMGAKQENLQGTGVLYDPGVANAIQTDKLGIGYNNLGYAYDDKTHKLNPNMEILPLDVNENGQIDPQESFYGTKDEVIKAIATGQYPSPPARQLYLVAKGKPTNPVVQAFLKYVLTEGQKLNIPTGYINIEESQTQKSLKDLGLDK
ncbi:MAG: substrate-binding domain-containing protein [Bacteroidales bacterium]|jgi:phosphate transport system substrate-binding protein|nr:substrate-binding domain-containing protein [Bacteroidales bacterium]